MNNKSLVSPITPEDIFLTPERLAYLKPARPKVIQRRHDPEINSYGMPTVCTACGCALEGECCPACEEARQEWVNAEAPDPEKEEELDAESREAYRWAMDKDD